MRPIDADEAIVNFGFEWDDIPPTREEFVYFLKKQPTVDAILVVRCRECKYAFKSGSSITGIRCEVWGTYDLFHACEPDWFCSHGKRKEGAD